MDANRAQGPVTVSAAADLTYAFQEIGKQFEAATGTRVVFNFGSTGQLAQQIEQGAPVDLFAAASISYIRELEQQGLIVPGTVQVVGRGRIVLWTRADSPLQIGGIEALTRPEIARIAIANPDHAPYGAAAREAMQHAGVWDGGAGQAGARRECATDAAVRRNRQRGRGDRGALVVRARGRHRGRTRPLDLDPPGASRTDRPGAGGGEGRGPRSRRTCFAAFVTGPQGRPVMRKYGFILPGEEPAP